MAEMFMFATGIENSSPTIDAGTVRVDEMETCGHYEQWRLDFEKVAELGIRFLYEFLMDNGMTARNATSSSIIT